MDKATLRQLLTQAEDHIDDARRRVEQQESLTRTLGNDGHDTAIAEQVLKQFKETLQTLQADRDLIEDMLRKTAK